MSTQAGGPIRYPSFPEYLELLKRGQGDKPGLTFKDIAELVGVEEATVIGWFDGSMPSTTVRPRIEKGLDYSFRERRFAECANAVGFPSEDAPEEIRALRTYAALLAYVQSVQRKIPQVVLLTFLGWEHQNTGGTFLSGSHAPEPERLTEALRRLPELPRHLSGEVLSACTPRVVLGAIIRDCRKQKNFGLLENARRVAAASGISANVVRCLEEEARGMRVPSNRAEGRERSAGGKGGYFKDTKTLPRFLQFLDAERRALGMVPAGTVAVAAVQDVGIAPPPAAAGVSEMSRAEVIARVRALHDRLGSMQETALALRIPRETLRGVLQDSSTHRTKPETIARLRDALPRAEERLRAAVVQPSAAPQPPPGPTASVPGDDRMARLESQMQALTEELQRMRTMQPQRDNGSVPIAAVDDFPFMPGNFRQHDDPVSDAELDAAVQRIRAVQEDLARFASIRDDARREIILRRMGKTIDDLFVAIEVFGKQYPIGAIAHVNRQREWTDKNRGVLPVALQKP